MKYTRRLKRLLAIILVLVTLIVNVNPQTVYANDIQNSIETETIKNSIIRTTLLPNTAQDWAIAFKDGIGTFSFFHNKVEEDVRDKNGMRPGELKISGAGIYGFDGRADLYKKVGSITYIYGRSSLPQMVIFHGR